MRTVQRTDETGTFDGLDVQRHARARKTNTFVFLDFRVSSRSTTVGRNIRVRIPLSCVENATGDDDSTDVNDDDTKVSATGDVNYMSVPCTRWHA